MSTFLNRSNHKALAEIWGKKSTEEEEEEHFISIGCKITVRL